MIKFKKGDKVNVSCWSGDKFVFEGLLTDDDKYGLYWVRDLDTGRKHLCTIDQISRCKPVDFMKIP